MKRKICLFLSIVLLVSIIPINGNAKKPPTLKTKSLKVEVDSEKQIKLKNYNVCDAKWKSTNRSVATVDDYGYVRGVSSGKCDIKVQCGKKKFTCHITVYYSDEQIAWKLYDTIGKVYFLISDYMQCQLSEEDDEEDFYSDWNEGFDCERSKKLLAHYISNMEKITLLCESINDCDKEFLLETWKMAIDEAKKQYEIIINTDWSILPIRNGKVSTSAISHYYDVFSDKYDELNP